MGGRVVKSPRNRTPCKIQCHRHAGQGKINQNLAGFLINLRGYAMPWLLSRRLLSVIVASLALSGCCVGSGCYNQSPTSTMALWDRRASLPKRDNGKTVKIRKTGEAAASATSPDEAELAALKQYSPEWWSVHDAIDQAADVKLAKRMIICRGCLPSKVDDQTGSIAPK